MGGGLHTCCSLISITKTLKKYEIKPPSHSGEGMGEGLKRAEQAPKIMYLMTLNDA